jgi:predicted transcriptional regulator
MPDPLVAVSTRIKEDTYRKIQELRKRSGSSVQEIVQSALDVWLSRREKKFDKDIACVQSVR